MFLSAIFVITLAISSAWSKIMKEEQMACSPSEFTCHSGECVHLDHYCDGRPDCVDGSDEAMCYIGESQQPVFRRAKKQVSQDRCRDNEWRCRDGACIHHLEKCNGEVDCPDGSDETSVICNDNICTDHEFRCSYGACVASSAPCNGVPECADNSDELLPYCFNQTASGRHEEVLSPRFRRQASCGKTQWKCRDGTCISLYGKCDGMKDCPDGSDETFALCRKTPCQSNWFRCTYGACVDGTAPCNKVQECADNSDELLRRCSNQSEEVRGSFKCDNGQEIPAFAHCDGAKDCSDGSDETVKACAGKTCASYLFQCAYGACVDQGSDCDNKIDCADGSDESAELCNRSADITPVTPPVVPATGGPCKLPPYPANGHYTVTNVAGAVPGQSFFSVGLNITCNPGYGLSKSADRLCIGGLWQPTPVSDYDCVRFCRLNKHPSVRFRCLLSGSSEGTRECNEFEPEGTRVDPKCNEPNYYSPHAFSYMRCIEGSWTYEARCNPGLVKNGTNITILVKDVIEIHISDFQYNVNNTAGKNVTVIDHRLNTTSDSHVTESPISGDYDYNIEEEDWRMGPTKKTRYPVTSTIPIPKTTSMSFTNSKLEIPLRDNKTGSSGLFNLNITNSTVIVNAGDKIYFRDEDP